MNNIILTLLFLFGTSFSFAQKSDSVRIAYDYVYFNPQKAIEMANRIIKTSENKDDQITARLIKTNAYSSLDDTYNALLADMLSEQNAQYENIRKTQSRNY